MQQDTSPSPAPSEPSNQTNAAPPWSESDAWWTETLNRVIYFQASTDEPEGGIGGTGRDPDEPEGGIGGTGRETESPQAGRPAPQPNEKGETPEPEQDSAPTILPTFLDIYDRDLDQTLSPAEMAWMETQAHGVPHLHMLEFDLDQDKSISPDEAWLAHNDLHDHVLLVRRAHFSAADQNQNGKLEFQEFIRVPAVIDLYHHDNTSLVRAYLSFHDDQGDVTFTSFHRMVQRSERSTPSTEATAL